MHRGRSLETGVDCVGLIFAIYRLAGRPIDRLDRPYSRRLAGTRLGSAIVGRQAKRSFDDVTALVKAGIDEDGDVWQFSLNGQIPHVGICIADHVYHMGDKLHRQPADLVRPLLLAAFRLNPAANSV